MSPFFLRCNRAKVRQLTSLARRFFCASCLLLFCMSTCLLSSSADGQLLAAPRIVEHPTSLIVRKHEPAKLSCRADGNPTPKIEWYKDNVKVHTTANRMLLGDSLVFLHVISKKGDAGDTGTYYCLARSEAGKAKSRNATLEVALLREEFRLMPENTRVALGEKATFECTPPRGHPEPVVSWTHNEQRIDLNSGRFKLDGHNLVISDVAQKDHGRYRCVAQNILGVRESPPAILRVLVKPYFMRAPEDVTAMSEEDVVFHCKVGGDPEPMITWKRDDGKILNARSQILEDKALRIAHVRPSDEGTYVCEVENTAGQIASSAVLSVTSLPSFVTSPKNVQVTAGNVAKFECLVSGNPQPVYFWSKEGTQVLMFPGNTYGKFAVSNDGTLSIANAEKEDQGFYICSAVSKVGSTINRAHLSVMVLSDVPPPVIRLGAANQTLPQGTKAFLPCEATGYPQVTLKWFFNQKPIYNDTHYTITANSLHIQNIHQSDTGIYTCLASNSNGMSTWNSRLHVESPRNPNINFHKMPDPSTFPEAPSRPVVVNVTESTITLMWHRPGSSGASNHLGCMLEYYSPDIKSGWVEVGRRIHSDVHTVHSLRPNTRYMFVVRAENKHGIGLPSPVSEEITTSDPYSSQTMADVDINQARSWLNDVSIRLRDLRTISSVSVKLIWSVVGNSELIDGYYIRYQHLKSSSIELQSNKFNLVTVFGGSSSSYILTDLRKYAVYQFFIVPFFKSIEGKPSNSLTVRTYEDVPSSPPLSLSAKALNSTCALLTWAPPSEETQNGQLLGYNLEILENRTLLYANLTLDVSLNSIVLYNLSLTSFYSIRAAAFTAVGTGPYSAPLSLNVESALQSMANGDEGSIHQQPSAYRTVNELWFFVFAALIFTILVIILVKIVFVYTHKKAHKGSTYEKAHSLNENYSDNFPKYDSNSSKYSSFPDNNEYAEVNDLKNYNENQEKITLMPYAMTPLIEQKGSSTNSSRTSYNPSPRAAYLVANENELATESLLNERKANYSNGSSGLVNMANSVNRANFLHRTNGATGGGGPELAVGNKRLPPPRALSQMSNEYESTNDIELPGKGNVHSLDAYEDNLSDFERNSSLASEFKNMRSIASIKYSMHPDPGRPYLEYKDSPKLSTFAGGSAGAGGGSGHHQQHPPSTRIILNPCDSVAYESTALNGSSGGHRSGDSSYSSSEVNHYLVSEELCKLPMNNFNTDFRGSAKGRPHQQQQQHQQDSLPMRYNLDHSFTHANGVWGGKRPELSIHDQFVKSKVHSKKRSARSVVNGDSDHR